MEIVADFDLGISYTPGKANVMADALSRKSYTNTLVSGGLPKDLADDLRELRLEIVLIGFVAEMEVQSTLVGKIRETQKDDKEIAEIKERMSEGKAKGFREDEHDTLWFEDSVHVPNNAEIRKLILQEAHDFAILDSPRKHQDVFGFEGAFLVDRYEEGYCRVRSSM